MEDIGAADRIVVVMSKKYLESHWCMAELLEIWNYSRRNKDDFGRRVRVLCLPDVKISDIGEQLEHSSRWKQRYDCIVAKVDKLGISCLGQNGPRRLQQMDEFHRYMADILNAIAIRVQPRTLEQLEQYGFE